MNQDIKNADEQETTYENTCFVEITRLSAQSEANQLKIQAEQGSADAQKKLADRYFRGNGVEQNSAKAVEWLKKSAEQGYFDAYFPLAECYFDGVGIEQDFTQAIKWFEQCAAHVFTRGYFNSPSAPLLAQCKLADCYFHYGDPVKAIEWLSKAAEQGSIGAQIKLEDYYYQAVVERNDIQAIEWLKRTAEQGHKSAQIKLADCYLDGVGVKKSQAIAIEWLKKAAGWLACPEVGLHGNLIFIKDGLRLAQRKLGFIFFNEGKYSDAVIWFKEAVRSSEKRDESPIVRAMSLNKELVRSQIELAICHHYSKEDNLANDLFKKASDEDDCFAHLWLGYLTYLKNKPAAEKITAFDPIYGCGITATYAGTLSPLEMENHNQRAKDLQNVKKNEDRIAKLLHMAAAGLFLQDEETNHEYLDIVRFAFPDEVIRFLEDENVSPAKVILAFYYHQKKDEKYIGCLIQASTNIDILATYLLGKHYKDPKYFDKEKATDYFNQVGEDIRLKYFPLEERQSTEREYSLNVQNFLAYSAKEELGNIKHQKKIEEKNKQLQEAEKELEDMMSMFAHKFRSPLDAIIYNTSHDNNPKLYAEAAQTMRGLLDIFSIISTDNKILTEKIKADCQGNARLNTVLSKTLNMILLHLLSAYGTEKIQQHYLAYAKAHGKIAASVTYKEWYDEHFELEQTLQAEWEQGFAALLSQSAPLAERLAWLEQHFFKLELIGFDRDDIQFKEYAITESLLTILLNEILVNAFKYYSSETRQAVVLEWSERDGKQILSCRNPSVRRERTTIKGSGKGHTFLLALARKIGGQFSKPKPQDDFVLEFGIPNELLMANPAGGQ
ncbi:MAG: tetratricopeptide repeat protein [Methylococcaceae bacterium]